MEKFLVVLSVVLVGLLSTGSSLAQADHQILFQVRIVLIVGSYLNNVCCKVFSFIFFSPQKCFSANEVTKFQIANT
jgi:hypothetical protein